MTNSLLMQSIKNKSIMYTNDDYFNMWMEKLYGTMREMSKDLKALVNTNDVFDKDDKLYG